MLERFGLETTLKLLSVRMNVKTFFNIWEKITCFWGAREEIIKVEAVRGNLHCEQIISYVVCVCVSRFLILFRTVSCSALCCGVH
jgi:hypothetical protein